MENTISMVKFLRISYDYNPARCLKEFSLAASFFRVKLLYSTTLSFMNVIIMCFHHTFFRCFFAIRRLYGTMSSAAGTCSWSRLRLCKYSCESLHYFCSNSLFYKMAILTSLQTEIFSLDEEIFQNMIIVTLM